MKKIISGVLVCAMLLVFLLPVGFASEQTAYGDSVVFYSENKVVKQGEDFVLDVNVKDNPGIVTFMIIFTYDQDVIDVSCESAGERLDDEGSIFRLLLANEKYGENKACISALSTTNIFKDGKLAGLVFTVKEDAPAGKSVIKVTLEHLGHFDDNEGTSAILDLADNRKESYDVEVFVDTELEGEAVSELKIKCLTEKEFADTYEERMEALKTPKPTPKPIYATPRPEKTPQAGGEVGNGNSNLKTVEVVLKEDTSWYMQPATDKLFEPDRSATRYEIVNALNGIFTVENAEDKDEFTDVTDSFYKKIVNNFAQAGIISGYGDGIFGGERNITRGEFVKLLTTAFNIQYKGAKNESLSDIKGHWAEEYISAFVDKGYILGYPDSSFKPDKNITRAEAVTVINRALGIETKSDNIQMFNDLTREHWAFDIVMSIF